MDGAVHLGRADLEDLVVLAEEDDLGSGGLVGPVVDHDDEDIADDTLTGASAVERHGLGTARGRDGVGDPSLPVRGIDDVDLLVHDDAGGIHEVLVDADRADVVDLRFRDTDPVQFPTQHSLQTHGLPRGCSALRQGREPWPFTSLPSQKQIHRLASGGV